jgi:hypothetical protein
LDCFDNKLAILWGISGDYRKFSSFFGVNFSLSICELLAIRRRDTIHQFGKVKMGQHFEKKSF